MGRPLHILAALFFVTLTGLAGCARNPLQGKAPAPSVQRLDAGAFALDMLPGQLVLGREGLFFTASPSSSTGSRRIYSLNLETGQVQEVLASRFYPDGVLDSYRLQLAGDRLIFLEISAGEEDRFWTLAGYDLASGEITVIDQAQNDSLGWPGPEVAVDGDWVVWIRKEGSEAQPRSVIHARNLATGEDRRLGDELDASREGWSWPNLAGELLVVERDRAGANGPRSDVFLIDLASGAVTALSDTGQASEPSLDGRYVAWKAGPRFGQGPLALYDLQTQELRTLDVAVEYPHSSDGEVIGWAEGKGLLRIDAASGRYTTLAPAESITGFRPALEVSLRDGRIAWLEWGSQNTTRSRARLRVQG